MRIGVQGQYDLYTSFNTREAMGRIPVVNAEPQEEVKAGADESVASVPEVSEERAVTGRNGDISEIADRLKTGDGFSSVNITDRIGSYNVQKAYSDIEMDDSLKQYQYFVGSGEVIDSSEDGIVIQKSGFDYF
ncbi:MAG: hypothetical protein K6A71_03595 [Lachnospiraceae bacterium]|nr:hypothetical protein [Lachnospiraceae bacterium]